MHPLVEGGDTHFIPRIIPASDIVLVEAHPTDPSLSYAFIKGLDEVEAGEPYVECLLDHSLEDLAQALSCETSHMKQDFSRKPLSSEQDADLIIGPAESAPEP